MREPLSDRLSGRWTDVLPLVGVPVHCLNGKNQPCPICGGKDRFRMFKRAEGMFICTHCGSMNGIDLAMKLTGVVVFAEMARKIEAVIGSVPFESKKRERSDIEKRKAMNDLWRQSRSITPDSPAGKYLTARTGITDYPPCLRAVDELRYWGGDIVRYFPAMIAMVTGPDGKPVNIYRTYLTKDGRKAPVDPPRRMMPGTVPRGSAVRLWTSGKCMGVSEGIETGISASIIHDVPVWSTLGTSGLLSWIPPNGIDHVMIFGDNDVGYGGQSAAYVLGHRLLALPGRKLGVEVLIPGHVTTGRDWNDEAKIT